MALSDVDYKVAGTQTVNGAECYIIAFSDEQGTFKEWLSKEHGIVIKFEQNLAGQTTSFEYKNIRTGPDTVPEETFKLPEGIQIIDLNDIMNNVARNKESK